MIDQLNSWADKSQRTHQGYPLEGDRPAQSIHYHDSKYKTITETGMNMFYFQIEIWWCKFFFRGWKADKQWRQECIASTMCWNLFKNKVLKASRSSAVWGVEKLDIKLSNNL